MQTMMYASDILEADAPSSVDMAPVTTISRRKRTILPLRKRDTVAWNIESQPAELLFRSPVDFNDWVTREERDRLVSDLVDQGIAFTTRKGHTPILRPTEGQLGWKLPFKCRRRRQYVFVNGRWQEAVRNYTDEF